MFSKFLLLILHIIVFAFQCNSQSYNILNEVNKTWETFCLAFDSLDYTAMAEIHSKELVRISSGERITDYTTYINNYKTSFEKAKNDNVINKISLRFFERINNDSIASERGIYKLVRINNLQEKQIYYGQFHVIFKKEKDKWKIFMDYDSNEGDSIGENNFLNAKAMYEFNTFIQD